jgi:hypothetical protein
MKGYVYLRDIIADKIKYELSDLICNEDITLSELHDFFIINRSKITSVDSIYQIILEELNSEINEY